MPLYGDLWVADASKEMLLQVWRTMIAANRPRRAHRAARDRRAARRRAPRGGHGRRPLARAPRRAGNGPPRHPRKLRRAGEELPKVFYDIVEMEAFAGCRMLVVGGGDSAVESAVGWPTSRAQR